MLRLTSFTCAAGLSETISPPRNCTERVGSKRIVRNSRLVCVRWKFWFSAVLFTAVLNGAHASGQASSSDQVDCKDPFWSTTSFCQSQLAASQTGSASSDTSKMPGMDTTLGQRSSDRGTQLYVDNGGSDNRRQNDTTLREKNYFPPDPIIDLQRLARTSTDELLPVFGRDLFQKAPSTFAPADQVAPLPDYVVGPGDQILLRLWGHDSLNSQLTVDKSGSIYVPQVGAIHVAGLRFDQLQSQIRSELSRTYRNFNLSVNLGQLRSIQVYVVGEARRPGAYTVSSLSTVLNALLASGGPDVQGSLRRIQVRREAQPPVEFDLYDLILRGDKSHDVQLQPGDTIFIPPAGPQVALAGSVKHPAIYELRDHVSVQELIALAGGYAATASKTEISLERIEAGQARRTLSVGLDQAALAMSLQDGDVLYVNHITRGFEQTVTIRGNLANPGRFPWHQGMRLSEIIPDKQSLLTNGYWRERNRLGVPSPLFEPRETYGQTAGYAYRPGSNEYSDINGALRPGQQRSYANGGNGQSESAEPTTAELLGTPAQAAQSGQIGAFSQLSSLSQQDASTPMDPQAVGSGQQQGSDRTLNERGSTSEPTLTRGSLAEQQEAAVSPSLATRGTPNRIKIPAPEIDWAYAVIERLNPNTLKSSLVPFNLGRLAQDHDLTQNLELQPGDVVTILSQTDVHVPIDEQTKYVRLEGEVVGAGTYSVGPEETLEDVVKRAGGLTSKAYLFGASFTRETARFLQQQRLDEYVSSLSIDMERSAAVRTASSTTGITDPNALVQERSLIAQLKQLRATGRVVLEFRPDSIGTGAIPKLPLEDGDVFRIPSRPAIVSVIGAVYGQNIYLYDSHRRVEDYITLAGKPNRIADWKHAFIIRADGSIYSRERAQGVWTNLFPRAQVNPGDTIVVPEKLIRPSALRQVIDYSQIFSQFALGAAAINVVR